MSETPNAQPESRVLTAKEAAYLNGPDAIVDKRVPESQGFARPLDVNAAKKLQQFLEGTIG